MQDNIHTNRTMATHLSRNGIMTRTIQSNIKHWTEGVIHQPEAATNSMYFASLLFAELFFERASHTEHIYIISHVMQIYRLTASHGIAQQFW